MTRRGRTNPAAFLRTLRNRPAAPALKPLPCQGEAFIAKKYGRMRDSRYFYCSNWRGRRFCGADIAQILRRDVSPLLSMCAACGVILVVFNSEGIYVSVALRRCDPRLTGDEIEGIFTDLRHAATLSFDEQHSTINARSEAIACGSGLISRGGL